MPISLRGSPSTDAQLRFWGKKRVPSKLRGLEEAFIHYEACQRRYFDTTGGDLGWWYTERSCVGMLAAAFWMSGGAACEEYRADKRGVEGDYTGRADLYLATRRTSLAVEVKWHEMSMNPKRGAWDRLVAKALGAAENDIDSSKEPADYEGVVVFSRPYLKKSLKLDLSETIVQFRETWLPSCEVWDLGFRLDFYPDWGRPHCLSRSGYYCPGVTATIGLRKQDDND